ARGGSWDERARDHGAGRAATCGLAVRMHTDRPEADAVAVAAGPEEASRSSRDPRHGDAREQSARPARVGRWSDCAWPRCPERPGLSSAGDRLPRAAGDAV